jgi:hypothetical protein
VQGFRSTFKTWCEGETNFSNQAVEFCIAHVPGDEAEKAYRRRSMLAKRKQIMESWLPSPPSNKPRLSASRLGSRPDGSGLLAVTGEADRTAAYGVCSSILYTLARPMPSALAIYEGPRPSAFI